ncbi:MAG TPA: hypothetical protein ENI86_07815 [Acidimicrobiales bacterium]|nr:hypothetical protein [Acidimicrobiales bacterium]
MTDVSGRVTLDVHPLMLRGLMAAIVGAVPATLVGLLIMRGSHGVTWQQHLIFGLGVGIGAGFYWAWRPNDRNLPKRPAVSSSGAEVDGRFIGGEERIDLWIILARALSFLGYMASVLVFYLSG